jgi:hypothetical protein
MSWILLVVLQTGQVQVIRSYDDRDQDQAMKRCYASTTFESAKHPGSTAFCFQGTKPR